MQEMMQKMLSGKPMMGLLRPARNSANGYHLYQPREILLLRIDENRRHLEELMALQNRMEKALAQWAGMPDGVPDGHSVCHLIESFAGNDRVPPDKK